MIFVFAFIFLNPYDIFLKESRVQVLKTIEECVIAPFGLVKFRHNVAAVVIVSCVSELQ
jgi:hypothetical protein